MNYWKLCDVAVIAAVLIAMCVLEKKERGKVRRVWAQSFCVSLVCAAPLALIETLSVFGVRLFDVDFSASWAYTPLDFMAFMAIIFLLVLLGGVSKLLPGPGWSDQDGSDSAD